MTTIMTTSILSVLIYLIMRSLEWVFKELWSAWQADKQDEIERLVDLIEGYKRMLDENAEDKKAVSK
jgi:hypothetical protein